MEKIKVSACIVTHNDESHVLDTIESLIQNTKDVDLHLYISDNDSNDQAVDKIRSRFTGVTVIENGENKGFGAGHNRVIDALRSEYHAVINPDILIDSDVLSQLTQYMQEHPDIGMIIPRVLNMDGTEQHLPKRNPRFSYLLGGRIGALSKYRREYTREEEDLSHPLDIEFCTGCFFVIKTELFKKIGGFDERYFMYFEDADLTRTVLTTERAVYYPGAYVFHKWERAGAKQLKYLLIQVRSMCQYFNKWRKKRHKNGVKIKGQIK